MSRAGCVVVRGDRQNLCPDDESYSQAAYAVYMYRAQQTMTEIVVQRMTNTPLQSDDGAGDDSFDDTGDGTTAIADAVKPQLKKPPMYKVFLLNDDYTPMEFVVEVLQLFFSLDKEFAVRVMLKVHTEGRGVCGVYTREVAETKAGMVNGYAREKEHPLLCEIEPSEDNDDDDL